MKKVLSLLLAAMMLTVAFAGCGKVSAANADGNNGAVYNDGRARPSSCGKLQVLNGKLCGEDGQPAILRGVSTHDLIVTESFLNEQLFEELSRDVGVNLFRLAMYTHGVGIMGYCTGGDRARYEGGGRPGQLRAAEALCLPELCHCRQRRQSDYGSPSPCFPHIARPVFLITSAGEIHKNYNIP